MRLALALLLIAAPCRAQALHGNELAAGAALNLALRGPWTAPAWRRPVPRLLLGQAVSLVYEVGIDAHAWTAPGHHPWHDLGGRLVGTAAAEVVWFTVRRTVTLLKGS